MATTFINVTTTRHSDGKSESTTSSLSTLKAHQLLLTVLEKGGINTVQAGTKLSLTHQDDDGAWITTDFEGASEDMLMLHVAFKNRQQTEYAEINGFLLRLFGILPDKKTVAALGEVKTLDLRAALELAREYLDERAGITLEQRRGYGYAPKPEPNLLAIAQELGLL